MHLRLSLPVAVNATYDHRQRRMDIRAVQYDGVVHQVTKTAFRHQYREGRRLYHVFSVDTEVYFFRLVFDTENLTFTIEEVMS